MNTKYAVTKTYYDNSRVELFDTLREAADYANSNACNLGFHSEIVLEKFELDGEILASHDRVDSGKARNAWQNYYVDSGSVGFLNEYDEFECLIPTESQDICRYECNLIYVVGDEYFQEHEKEEAKKYAEKNNLKIVEKYTDGDQWYDTEEELHEADDCLNYIMFN